MSPDSAIIPWEGKITLDWEPAVISMTVYNPRMPTTICLWEYYSLAETFLRMILKIGFGKQSLKYSKYLHLEGKEKDLLFIALET